MSKDVQFSEAQISKILQSGESFGSWLANLGKNPLKIVTSSLARDNLPGLVRNLA